MSKILADEKQLKDYLSFNKDVRMWTMHIRGESVRILQKTHSSEKLKHLLNSRFLEDKNDIKAYVGLGLMFLKYDTYTLQVII